MMVKVLHDTAFRSLSDKSALLAYLSLYRANKLGFFGEYLLQTSQISAAQLTQALDEQKSEPKRHLGEILIRLGYLTNDQLQAALRTLYGIPLVSLAHFTLEPGCLSLLPERLIRKYQALPLLIDNNELVVAMISVPGPEVLAELEFGAKRTVHIVLADTEEIAGAIFLHFDVEPNAGLDGVSDSLSFSDDGYVDANGNNTGNNNGGNEHNTNHVGVSTSNDSVEAMASQQPIVRLVNAFLSNAIRQRASDIHLRPQRDGIDLSFRIDGTLIPIRRLQRQLMAGIVGRIKILARMNVAEHRLAQDGHIQLRSGAQQIDMRVSVLPLQYGESVVIRLLNKAQSLRDIAEIGLSVEDELRFRALIQRSSGMLLVTGPTGSGKTTTLYAALQELKNTTINIVTVEDPIEYELSGMSQVQLVEQIGFGFARTLRHILRHDPDVIMVGEIRDQETCKVALESALTGHLVLSTLHTNDATGAVLRLQEMGMSTYMIKSALVGVLAQRLVRLNCQHCLQDETISSVIRQWLGAKSEDVFSHSVGCDHCHHTGFNGRAAVYELFVLDEEVCAHIDERMTSLSLHELALKKGMRTMTAHGLELARARRVSAMEVYRQTS